MSQGLAVISGSHVIHKLLKDGTASFSGSVTLSGTMEPDIDNTRTLGQSDKRWQDVYATQTTIGAIFEYGLETEGIGQHKTGTVVSWRNGKLEPSSTEMDVMVMGVIREGKDQPIIMGAEEILVTGFVEEGDFLVTSNKQGHAKSHKNASFSNESLIGRIIGQALENSEGESKLIKCMICKR